MATPARSPLVATVHVLVRYDSRTPASNGRVFGQVEQYVKDAMAANDASHDFNHIDRVRNTAVRLAREEVSRSFLSIQCLQ